MQGPNVPPGLFFPTRQEDLDDITTFATAHGKTFVDAEALTIEIKTSWIETTGIPNTGDYITTIGSIPTYDKTDPTNGCRTARKTRNC